MAHTAQDTEGSRLLAAHAAVKPGGRTATAAAAAPADVIGDISGSSAQGAAGRHQQHPTLTDLVVDSPFIDLDHPIGLYEGLKLVVMLPVVVFKWAVLLAAVVYSWSVLLVLLAGHRTNEPMSTFRRTLVGGWIKAWSRFVLLVSGFYRIPVRGWANMQAAQMCRAVIVFNHESYTDPLVLGALLSPSGVAKASIAQLPFIADFAHGLQFLFVERRGTRDTANRHTLRTDPIQAIAHRAADPRFPLIMIAPEATTKAKRCLLKFRRGAFSVGRPVVPVLLRYSYERFNPGWGVVYTPLHLWRLLSQFANYVSVEVLPPYHPSPQERADPALFAANVRELMASRLEVALVEQSVGQERELILGGVMPNLRGTRAKVPDHALLEK